MSHMGHLLHHTEHEIPGCTNAAHRWQLRSFPSSPYVLVGITTGAGGVDDNRS